MVALLDTHRFPDLALLDQLKVSACLSQNAVPASC